MSVESTRDRGHPSARGVRRGFDLALAFLFVLGIATPLAGLVAGSERAGELAENRRLAPPPALPGPDQQLGGWLAALPPQVDAWFADHFAFRDVLIGWNAVVAVLWLGSAPEVGKLRNPEQRSFELDPLARTVLQGREDWFYYFGAGMLDDHRGLSPMTPEELQSWQALLERRRDELAEHGADYLLVIVPEKQSVYPQFLPAGVVRHGPTRARQLAEHLAAHSNVSILDLGPTLAAASEEQLTYHRTGTHWNDFGALRAAQAILTRLAERHLSLEVPRDEDFTQRPRTDVARPFLSLIGLRSWVSEDYVFLEPRGESHARTLRQEGRGILPGAVEDETRWAYLRRATGREELPRAVVVHDSFVGASLEPILSEQFESVGYYWRRRFSWGLIKNDRPDVVIEERSERYFLDEP